MNTKPRIVRATAFLGNGWIWVCGRYGELKGAGSTPTEAYLRWKNFTDGELAPSISRRGTLAQLFDGAL